MKHYIIADLSQSHIEKLTAANIQTQFWDFEGKAAILISEQVLPNLLQILRAEVAKTTETSFENIYNITLKFNTENSSSSTNTPVLEPVLSPEEIKRRDISRDKYVAACHARISDSVNYTQKAWQQNRALLTHSQAELMRLARARAFIGLKENRDILKQKFAQEYLALTRTPRVKSVSWDKRSLSFNTAVLYIADPVTRNIHEIGNFRITFFLDLIQDQDCILWINSSRKVDGAFSKMNAPHIFADGTASAHELRTPLIELIAAMEFAQAADLAIQFVEQCASPEYLKFISNWPLSASKQ